MGALAMGVCPELYVVTEDTAESWGEWFRLAGYDILCDRVSDEDAKFGVFSKGTVTRGREKVEIIVLTPDSSSELATIDPLAGRFVAIVRAFPAGRWPWSPLSTALLAEVKWQLERWGALSRRDLDGADAGSTPDIGHE